MLRFYAGPYIKVVRLFGQLGAQLNPDEQRHLATGFADGGLHVSPQGIRTFKVRLSLMELQTLEEELSKLPVSNSLRKQLASFKARAENAEITDSRAGEFSALASQLADNFINELDDFTILMIPPSYRILYEQPEPFGQKVVAEFPDATYDIAAASRCLALDEWTACVFHSMRVLEHGLRNLAGRLSLNMSASVDLLNWNEIITNIENEIGHLRNLSRVQRPVGELMQFYSGAATNFRYFKDAWRNEVSHSRSKYDGSEATDIYLHVQQFMQALANRRAAEEPQS
jgi:hypothetical protein